MRHRNKMEIARVSYQHPARVLTFPKPHAAFLLGILFVWLVGFSETEFFCIALAVLALQTRLTLNSEVHHLPSAEIKRSGQHHLAPCSFSPLPFLTPHWNFAWSWRDQYTPASLFPPNISFISVLTGMLSVVTSVFSSLSRSFTRSLWRSYKSPHLYISLKLYTVWHTITSVTRARGPRPPWAS